MFWHLEQAPDSLALIDPATGESVSYAELNRLCDLQARLLAGRRGVVALHMDRSVAAMVAYVTTLRCGMTAMMLDARVPMETIRPVEARYAPELRWTRAGGFEALREDGAPPHADLGVLLPTSGSTGDPKFARISFSALNANAESIAQYLGITTKDRALTVLPVSYAYGLSVVNSHLAMGAGLCLVDEPVTSRTFWSQCQAGRATSLAGVPYTYEMMARLRIERQDLPHIQTLTQAGGALRPELASRFCTWTRQSGRQFWVMYGQTEACARMSYVPPDALMDKLGSVGVPIPGGALRIEDGELVYDGANVMMGYADGRASLTLGDELHGTLHTGDLGRVDADGFFWVEGRRSRFIKLYGHRVNLDWVESRLAEALETAVAVVELDGQIAGFAERVDAHTLQTGEQVLIHELALRKRSFTLSSVDALPRTPSGKLSRSKLRELARETL